MDIDQYDKKGPSSEDCWDISSVDGVWHKLTIVVDKTKKVQVFLGDNYFGSFTAHFETRGSGGPMMATESTTLDVYGRFMFRLFHIKGTNDSYF